MRGIATASGATHEKDSEQATSHDHSENWICDTEQLTNWQLQLVDCCHAINDQLSQIREGLASFQAPHEEQSAAFSLRVVGHSPSQLP